MNKSRAVHILNSAGGSFTSLKRARKYLSTGRAQYVDRQTIRMIEDDPRHQACVVSIETARREPAAVAKSLRHSPSPFGVVPFVHDGFLGQTFLHYPQVA